MNLFELNEKFRELEQMTDLDDKTLKDTIDALECDRYEKLDNIATWIEENNSQIIWIKNRIAKLRDMQKSLTNKNANLMEYLTEAIDDTGYKSIQTKNHILKPRFYTPSVEIVNEKEIPECFIKTETVKKIDKAAIKKALQDGEPVEGAEIKANRKTVIR